MRRPVNGRIFAVLDVGTTKVCCIIAKVEDGDVLRIVGVGHQVSRGVRAGTIVDMSAAELAIGTTVHMAERMAGETIRQVLVNISGGQLTSQTFSAEVPIGGHEVCDDDLRRALAQARRFQGDAEQRLIHSIAVGYVIDHSHRIQDPRGMVGDTLGVQLHTVSAGSSAVRNLTTCISRCHLDIASFVVSPYASGLAALVEEEMMLGCILIDMGGGTTSISIFVDGKCVYVDSVPVGGIHVTNDIARGLITPLAHAERMKTLYGSTIANAADEVDLIEVPRVGENEIFHVDTMAKSRLIAVIHSRMEEIFELVRERLEVSGMGKVAGRRVVLTGGGSQLPGMCDLAQSILDKQVRLGKPVWINGVEDVTDDPAFSTAVGLLAFAMQSEAGLPDFSVEDHPPKHFLARVALWLKQNL